MRFYSKIKTIWNVNTCSSLGNAEEYGKLKYVGSDFLEFDVIERRLNGIQGNRAYQQQLVLEAVVGGADISRIVAEVSSQLPSPNKD